MRRNMMVSTFNCKKCLWRNLKIARYGVGEPIADPTIDFRFFSAIQPIYDQECDRVSRVLVLGGFTLDDSLKQHTEMPFLQLDFTCEAELLETVFQKQTAPVTKQFKEDE